MTDAIRANPPAIGSIIGYRFQELTKAGVPRFPTFLGERLDKTEAEDAEVPEHRKGAVEEGEE
jgi:DNA ligase-1